MTTFLSLLFKIAKDESYFDIFVYLSDYFQRFTDNKIQISWGTSKYDKLNGSFGSSQKTSLLMSHIETEISATNDKPSSIEFFIHILFNLLCHFLLVWSIFYSVINDVFRFEFNLRLHFRVEHFYSPFLSTFIHPKYYKLQDLFDLSNWLSKIVWLKSLIFHNFYLLLELNHHLLLAKLDWL